jgi:pimeloyl-ACP methyl ester carboxylesterase
MAGIEMRASFRPPLHPVVRLASIGVVVVACGSATGSEGTPPPTPQDNRTVLVRNGDVTIAGTLDLPSTPGPYPLMIFVPGSGRTTRESDRAAVDVALPNGVAVFTYDKRGLGQSTGTFEEVTTENSERVLTTRASDVRAIVEQMATDPRIRANKIFLWGTSQGAWVAPLVAAQTTKVAFIICVAGGGSPVGTVIEYERQGRDASVSIETLTQRLSTFGGPFGYDPQSTISSLRIPALWIYGGLDRNTPTFLDIPRLEAIRASQSSDSTIAMYPRMNHDMIDVDIGGPPPALFPEMIAWAGPLCCS